MILSNKPNTAWNTIKVFARASRLMANDHPRCSWQAFIHDFGYDTDIGIAISRCYEVFVDAGYPKLGKSGIESG